MIDWASPRRRRPRPVRASRRRGRAHPTLRSGRAHRPSCYRGAAASPRPARRGERRAPHRHAGQRESRRRRATGTTLERVHAPGSRRHDHDERRVGRDGARLPPRRPARAGPVRARAELPRARVQRRPAGGLQRPRAGRPGPRATSCSPRRGRAATRSGTSSRTSPSPTTWPTRGRSSTRRSGLSASTRPGCTRRGSRTARASRRCSAASREPPGRDRAGVGGQPRARLPRGLPLSVLAFHGTSDPVVPYMGGQLSPGLGGLLTTPVPTAVASWATRDGSRTPPARWTWRRRSPRRSTAAVAPAPRSSSTASSATATPGPGLRSRSRRSAG